ncbi:MAG: hypothetical protein ACR2MT_08355 [Aurantibacter sp.]
MANSKKRSRKGIEDIREFKTRMLSRENLEKWGAHAMGIGRKLVKGKPTNQFCLRIFVENKQPTEKIGTNLEIPPYFIYQPEKSKRSVKIYTDVIQEPMARFEPVDPETMIRPVPGGVSGGILGSTGTIGGYVWDNTDDTIVMLSNHHVFGHNTGTTIVQQGSADGGSSPTNDFGEVKRGIPRISGGAVNTVDCSVGDPDDSDDIDLSVVDIGPAVYAVDVAEVEMLVEKYGQTTRHTYGMITDEDWEGWVSTFYFEQCFRVDNRAPSTDWSAGGDSGSLVFSQTPIEAGSEIKPVVGLHFAGASTYGIGCHIQNVFSRLDLTTLCSGAFSSFLDSLFGREEELELEDEVAFNALASMAKMQVVKRIPRPLLRKARCKAQSRNLYSGISRDIQDQLRATNRGRKVVSIVNDYRHELLTLLAKDNDIRRVTTLAVSSLAEGTTTSSEFMEKKISKNDIANFERLLKEVGKKGGRKLKVSVDFMKTLLKNAEGKSIAGIMKIK